VLERFNIVYTYLLTTRILLADAQ